MADIELTYFDIHGGRGEVARLAMIIGDVPFEDRRVKLADWPAVKPQTPFGGLPVLEVAGRRVTQSNGINRFVGKLSGLYPADHWQAALCDEVMDAVEDVLAQIAATFPIRDEAQRKARREALVGGPIPLYLERLQSLLESHGGAYFADGRLTVADLKVFVWVRNLRSGVLDHIPADLVDRVAPRLVEHHDRIRNHPPVKAYYDALGLA